MTEVSVVCVCVCVCACVCVYVCVCVRTPFLIKYVLSELMDLNNTSYFRAISASHIYYPYILTRF